MNEYSWLAVYCLLVLVASILGGYLPFVGQVTHSRLQLYLSVAAGVMLGASFFHVMPEAMQLTQGTFGWWMSLGVVGLFCIERFIAPHSHELDGGQHHHDQKHEHRHDHPHSHEDSHGSGALAGNDHRAAAPAVAGWAAVLGLTIHTFTNGVGLAGSVHLEFGAHEHAHEGLSAVMLPGLPMFLAIVLHKPADALAISMVLSRKGVSRRMISLVQFGFALMVPVGAIAYSLTRGAIAMDLENQLTGAALAFSAGTFLFVALSDLLPEVQFHKHDRIQLFLALTLGVAFMGGIAVLEGDKHGEHAANGNSEHKENGKNSPDNDDDSHHEDHGKKHPHKH
jgi:zinc and cadmium transporter